MAAALLAAGSPVQAAGLDEAAVRAFVAGQQRAWNGQALDVYFAAFRPDALFTDQYRTPGGQVVPYGTSSLAEARAQARRFFATSRTSETSQVQRIDIAPDRRSVRVLSRTVARIEAAGRIRVVCAERTQTLSLRAGRLISGGQTDTILRCPR